jgi:hypothetical protein
LISGVRHVLAQRWNDMHITVWRERIVKSFGYLAGAAVIMRPYFRSSMYLPKI